MVENSINVFASDEYILLAWLSDHITETKTKKIVKYSQTEIAQELECSPTTINKRIQSLKQAQCIRINGKKGYIVTEKGNQVVKKMREIESLVGGNQK